MDNYTRKAFEKLRAFEEYTQYKVGDERELDLVVVHTKDLREVLDWISIIPETFEFKQLESRVKLIKKTSPEEKGLIEDIERLLDMLR